MGTTLVSAAIERAAGLLQDKKYVRWTMASHLDWLTDGQREACVLNPSLYLRTVDHPLTKGTRQTMPLDARALRDIPRNVDGGAITPVSRRALDMQIPDWHADSRAGKRVLHYCYTVDQPKQFLVYPPSPGGNAVEMVYEAIPPVLSAGSALALDDSYTGALVDYLMHRAYAKDSEYAANADLAALHYSRFLALVKGGAPAAPAAA